MKLPIKILIISLVVALILAAIGMIIETVRRARKPPEKAGLEVVKHFTLSSSSEMKELDDKLLADSRTSYVISEADGDKFLKAVSEDSASALFYRHKLVPEKRPFVSWDWKAGKFPSRSKEEALDKKDEFDFVAQFYVIFSSRFFLNAKAIQYVWTENVPAGTVSDSPYTKNVKILVLESGMSEEWKHEERNINEDFEKLFEEELNEDVDAVALMTDSDSTDTSAEAYFKDIKIGYLGALPGEKKSRMRKRRSKAERSKRFPFLKIKGAYTN
ncbi:MAG: DUF3047 domain-containing protein [Candidatus Omnitrophota bacterium]